jgi:hypothetical protein
MILVRSAGFGGGSAIMAALLLGGVIWWSSRPRPWSENAVTAKPTELYTRQVDEEVRVEFHYAITNHSNTEYTLPSAESGALMRHVPNASSVEKLDGATWDTTIRIPPRQSVSVVFSVPYRLAEFSTSNAQLDTVPTLLGDYVLSAESAQGLAVYRVYSEGRSDFRESEDAHYEKQVSDV